MENENVCYIYNFARVRSNGKSLYNFMVVFCTQREKRMIVVTVYSLATHKRRFKNKLITLCVH